jgi:hypothetical protein
MKIKLKNKMIILLIAVNLIFVVLALFIKIHLPYKEWVKGPIMHSFSAYSTEHASMLFWTATAFMLDIYVVLVLFVKRFILNHNILKIRILTTLVILLITGISFITTEYSIRFVIRLSPWYTSFRPHPDLLWWNRPNINSSKETADLIHAGTNSFSFRYNEDFNYNKVDNEYRIFVLGNSSTFGSNVGDNETFSYNLELMLKKQYSDRKIMVINAACPGHTTYQNNIELKDMIIPFHPDMVIIANNNDAALEYMKEKDRFINNKVIKRINQFLYKYDYYLLLQRVIADYKLVYAANIRNVCKPKLTQRVPIDDYITALENIINTSKQNKVKTMFVNMPVNYATLDKFPKLRTMYYSKEHQETLKNICRMNNQILVDADAEFNRVYIKGLYQTILVDGIETEAHFHPSAKGHLKIAEILFKEILEKKLIQ